MRSAEAKSERQLPRGAWLILLFVAALICLDIAQVIYRVLLPTEGWNYSQGTTTDDYQANVLIFTTNLLGPPSPIQAGDRLTNIAGMNIDQLQTMVVPAISDGWQAGQIVHYTVLRDGQAADLAVPLKHWTLASIVAYTFRDFSAISNVVSALLMFSIGLFVLLKRPYELAARALLLLGSAFLANNISLGFIPDGPTTQTSSIWWLTALLNYWIFGFFIGPTFFTLSLTFPRPKNVLRRAPWLLALPYTIFWLLVAIFGWLPQIGYGLTGGFFLLSLLSTIHSAFTQRDVVSRTQLRWMLGGLIGAILLFVPFVLLTVVLTPESQFIWAIYLTAFLSNLSFPVFIVCLSIAILRYRLFDIDIIIRRTLVYSVLTITLGLVYVGCILLGQALLTLVIPQADQSQVATVASTLVIAALFFPLRRRIQNLIDRRFYRRKYNAQQVLAQFALTARDETDLARLTDELLRVVDTTVQPEFAGVWLAAQNERQK